MRALRVNKLRSALTVLGIVVGVAAVVCMVSVGAGAQAEVSEKIRTLGANLLLVMPGARNSGGARLESGTQPTLTEEDAAAIRRELVDVQVAAPLLSRSMPLVAANRNWVTLVAGINADYLVAREWQIASGRSFTSDEIASGAKVAIVGSVIIEELFDGRAGIGETFRIGNVPFTVIGVLDKKGLGAAGRSQDDVVFIPLSTAKSRVLGAVRGTTREALDFISIKVSDATAMPEMEREIEALASAAAPHSRGCPQRFQDRESSGCPDCTRGRRADPRHSVDRGGSGFAGRWRHQHHEHHAGFGDRTHPRNRFAYGRRGQPPRYPMAIPDRSLDPGVDGRACGRDVGSRRGCRDRMESWLAYPDQPMGDHLGLWICGVHRNFVWPLSGPSGRAA